jgi:hypothetical protein
MNLSRKLFLSFAIFCAPNFAHAQDIEWQVLDRYRLFEAKDPSSEITPLGELSPADNFLANLDKSLKQNDAAIIYQEIANFLLNPNDNDFDNKKSPIYQQTKWQGQGFDKSQKPKNTREYSKNYLYPETYNISAKYSGEILKSDICDWQVDGFGAKKLPCNTQVILPIKAKPSHDGALSWVSLSQYRDGELIFGQKFKIEFPDTLIIALGDSYSSGEGNPDLPQSFADKDFTPSVEDFFNHSIDPYERWWAKHQITKNIIPADWWDGICHRSLMSQHAIATMIYAAKNPKAATSFASFSCAGAQVFGGILSEQVFPVGQIEQGTPSTINNEKFRVKPQLEQAINLICNNEIEAINGTIDLQNYPQRVARDEYLINATKAKISQSKIKCKNNFAPRKVDKLLLSVGGNDSGFVGAIVNALVPRNSGGAKDAFVSFIKDNFDIAPSYISERRVRFTLPIIYDILDKQIKNGLVSKDTQIIQSQYPTSFNDENGNFCNGPKHNQLFGAFNSLYLDENTKSSKRWRTEITELEGREIKENLFEPLNKTISQNAARGWGIVGFNDAFDKRGWCAGNNQERAQFNLPALDYNNVWTPFAPNEWQAYSPKTRLFRSANDTALTQIGSNKGFPIIDTIFDHDKSVFATFGMFHPTFEGHLIMGQEIAKSF